MTPLVYGFGFALILSFILTPILTLLTVKMSLKELALPQVQRKERARDYSLLEGKLRNLYKGEEKELRQTRIPTGISLSPPDFRLRGTIISQHITGAFLESGGRVFFVKEGEEFKGYTVSYVYKDKVILKRGGNTYELRLEIRKSKGGASGKALSLDKPSGEVVVSRREIEKITADPAKMFTQIRLVPYVKGGETKGFIFEWVKPGSIFDRLGIRRGDILVSINNMSIRSGEDAFRILQILRNEPSLKIVLIRRRGKKEEINVRIE